MHNLSTKYYTIRKDHMDFLKNMHGFTWQTTIQPGHFGLHAEKALYIKSEMVIDSAYPFFVHLKMQGAYIDEPDKTTMLRLHLSKEISDIIREVLRNGCECYLIEKYENT